MISKKNIALHLVGSPTSAFFFDLSMLYARSVVQPKGFEHLFVITYPNGRWSVAKSLQEKTTQISLGEMMHQVTHVHVAIPHLFCHKGLTSVRILFEDTLNIPLVGSSGQVLNLVQNKEWTKLIAKDSHLNVPEGITIRSTNISTEQLSRLTYPLIVKPNNTDNSDGLSLVKKPTEIEYAITKALKYDEEVLLEEFIAGRELRGAVIEMNDSYKVLPFIEYHVSADHPIRNPEDKLQLDENSRPVAQSNKLTIPAACPAEVDQPLRDELSEHMIKLHKALKCRDFSMFDFRIDQRDGKPYLLEAGLFWSFSETSMISAMLKAANMDLKEITRDIWLQAVSREKGNP